MLEFFLVFLWQMELNAPNKIQIHESATADIFDMDAESFSLFVRPIAAEVANNALESGLYISYAAPEDMPNCFIHEYKDGRQVVVQIDLNTGEEHEIR